MIAVVQPTVYLILMLQDTELENYFMDHSVTIYLYYL